MNLITLSEDLKYWRAERPDEWTMDRFIRAAEKLERSTIHNKDYAELIQTRGAQEHRLMDLQDRFDNLSIEYAALKEDRDAWEQSENSCDEQYNILFAEHEELKLKHEIKTDVQTSQQLAIEHLLVINAELEKHRDKLHESNNRQSDIIYDLKVQIDTLSDALGDVIGCIYEDRKVNITKIAEILKGDTE